MSLSGMTGFARCEGVLDLWAWAVEARSVNGRNLEVRFRGPPGFDGLERSTREAAQSRFQRGQLNVNVQARLSDAAVVVRINLQVIETYLNVSDAYVAAGRAAPPRMDGLLGLRGVVEAGDEVQDPDARSIFEAAILSTIVMSLDGLSQARLAEGAALADLLVGFLDHIEATTTLAVREAASQPGLLRDRFARRLTELAGEAASADRIMQEAAAMAVKCDVREELDRLAGHVASARRLIAEPGAAGRRLDFLTQELMREANTLCSKAVSHSLTTLGLELKATIDQFREQAQNVE
jgi:uncharacterized protein (TIGR00255 family)